MRFQGRGGKLPATVALDPVEDRPAPVGTTLSARPNAGGCLQTAYAGEILFGCARRRKIAGLVIDGALRDIVLGGTKVSPGDIVLGDNDGLVLIPLASAKEHLATAQERAGMEAERIAQLEAGGSLVRTLAVPEAI